MGKRFSSGRGHARSLIVVVGVVVALAACAARADDEALLPGHSTHGESFDTGPRRAAHLVEHTGDVHVAVSTSNADAQKFFDQGIGQLHGFWYLEAERSFRQVAAIDPDCAMAYWGMAMANINNAKRAKAFIAEAVKRKDVRELKPIEAAWIDVLAEFYRGEIKPEEEGERKPDPKKVDPRKKAFVATLKQMREQFPDDLELKAFSAFYIWQYKILDQYATAGKLLDEVLKEHPKHPANHYRIHLLDGDNAKDALTSAANCGPSAPGIAHMWHMPGHIYSDLKRYADAAWQQEASARTDHAYMIQDRVMPYEIHNYAHNNEWLIRDLVFVGRISEAIDLARNMIELPRHPKYNQASNRGSGAEYGRARLIDVLAQHQMWEQYLALCDGPYLSEDGEGVQQIQKLRYLGVAYAAEGRSTDAERVLATLQMLKNKPPAPTTHPAAKIGAAGAADTSGPATRPAGDAKRRKPGPPKIAPVDAAIAHVRGEMALSAGEFEEAATLLTTAEARKEHIAFAYLAGGNTDKAIKLAGQAVADNPGQTYPLASDVLVLHKSGKKDEAAKVFKKLRTIAANVDLTVEPYKALSSIAPDYGFDADWRTARKPPADLGERPPLDTLGPFRWHPSMAPQWSATAADRSKISLSDFQGKPVVVIFYLGHGCLHCTQQLHAFAPMAQQFADAGIALVAIGIDGPDSLNQAWEGAKLQGGAFPFPLASDAGLGIFKSYGCYDDFEKSPLHGTFLIDGNGSIRWQDISAEPFMDAAFLLKESKRLLNQQLH